MSGVQAVRWVVRPHGIETTRFGDPESFYLSIRRGRWHDDSERFVVSPNNDSMGFTRHGKLVRLSHDVNAKHAFHRTFKDACALAELIADGLLVSEEYRHWRVAEEQMFGPPTPAPQPDLGGESADGGAS